jgi:hypothetical protein
VRRDAPRLIARIFAQVGDWTASGTIAQLRHAFLLGG